MKKDDLIRNLKAELLKLERQNTTYGTGETRYDLMIKDVLNYIENSIPKKKLENKIKELNGKGNYRTKNNPNGRVHFHVEPCDYQIQVLQELLEEK